MCDHCGGRLFQREDDRPEAITVRLEAYERSTAPLIEFYRNLGLLLPIAAKGSPDEILARTLEKLQQLQKLEPRQGNVEVSRNTALNQAS